MSAVLVEFPSKLIEQVDELAGGSANRTHYLLDLIEDAVIRQRQIDAIRAATGAWKDEDHPELASISSSEFVRQLRSIESQRYNPLAQQEE
jgi:hypothetical protein